MKMKCLFSSAVLLVCSAAHAWKPSMHAAIAEAARRDALDGFVEIPIFSATRPGDAPTIRRYPVDPELLEALRRFPDHYRAGTMGPDAYPDILTGQMVIHPDAPDNTLGGTNVWLEHLWRESLKLPVGTDRRLKVRAFVTGYLTHGAGDMFGHTFVNSYAGGDFDVASTNFLRHLVLEGYVAKHAPDLASTSTSVEGIESWIYSSLVDCRKGTYLADRLYQGDKVVRSFPYIFSKLRDELQAKVDYSERHKDDVRQRLSAPIVAYEKAWIKDIDDGLKAFVTLSHDIAQHLVLFDADHIDEERKDKILEDKANAFVNGHLISMLGAPDFVGTTRGELMELWDSILYSVISEEEVIRLKTKLIDTLFSYTGLTYDQVKDYLKRPEHYFDRVMSAEERPRDRRGRPLGRAINLTQINQMLGIRRSTDKFDLETFAPAYNTLVMSKLILLPPSSVASLMRDLGAPTAESALPANMMLGYNRKFDGSAQWGINPEKMLLESKGVFRRVFKAQDGDEFQPDPAARPIPKTYRVMVKVKRVRALDGGIDFGSSPDFYPVITIAGVSKSFDAIDNKDDVSPAGWIHAVTSSSGTVRVRINIWDEDGNLAGDDDLCDANPSSSKKEIRFDVDCVGRKFTGMFTGTLGTRTTSGDGADKVEVQFEVSVTEG